MIYKECEAIQQELHKSKTRQSSINKAFAELVLEGRLTTAMNLIQQEDSRGLLQPNENALKELKTTASTTTTSSDIRNDSGITRGK